MSDQQRLARIEKRIRELEHLLNAPGKQDEPRIHPEKAPDHKGYPTGGEVPSRSHIKTSPHDPDQTDYAWYKTIKGWNMVIQIIAVPFACWYAIITFDQWRDLRSNFREDQRAWISIKEMSLMETPQPAKRSNFRVEYVNSGKTPALDVSMEDVRMSIIPGITPHPDITSPGQAALGPNSSGNFFGGGTLSAEAVAAINAHIAQIFVMGRISYRDTFGEWHNTTYCGFYPTKEIDGRNLFNCPYGNRMD